MTKVVFNFWKFMKVNLNFTFETFFTNNSFKKQFDLNLLKIFVICLLRLSSL